ncbi:MAG: DUF721 domain-containing protein [Nitrospirales bacterium]|nr:DUF721 domain-containing protein [Nitrospirales bacterium]
MRNVGSLLSTLIKSLGIEEKLRLESLKDDWQKIFGAPLSLHTQPAEIHDHELLIYVDSPAWLNQLKFFRDDMLAKLRPYGIRELKFKRGTVYHEKKQTTQQDREPAAQRPLTAEEKDWIEEETSGISDDELRDQIRRAMERSLSRKKKA